MFSNGILFLPKGLILGGDLVIWSSFAFLSLYSHSDKVFQLGLAGYCHQVEKTIGPED